MNPLAPSTTSAGIGTIPHMAAELFRYLKENIAKWAKVVKAAGIAQE